MLFIVELTTEPKEIMRFIYTVFILLVIIISHINQAGSSFISLLFPNRLQLKVDLNGHFSNVTLLVGTIHSVQILEMA